MKKSEEKKESIEEFLNIINENPYDIMLKEKIASIQDKWEILILYIAIAEKTGKKTRSCKIIKSES